MKDIITPINTPDGLFHDGDQSTGALGTIVTAQFQNDVQAGLQNAQAELIKIIKTANPATVLDPAKTDQMLTALYALFLRSGNNLSEIATAGTAAQTAARNSILAAALAGSSSQQFSVAAATNAASAVRLDQFQTGINGNGAYIKFPNGTIICRQTLTSVASSTTTWTFPLAFGAAPQILLTPFPSGVMNYPLWLSGSSATGCNIYNNNNTGIQVMAVAIY